MRIDLPSGLVLDVRKIQGHELISLAQAAESPSGPRMTELLRGCFQAVIDPGPYAFAKASAAAPDWSLLLTGDVIRAVLLLRAMSVAGGDRYDFPVRCEECGNRYDWEIASITNDLPVKALSEESRDRLKNHSGRFDTMTLSGTALAFKLMTEADQEPRKAFMKKIRRKTMTPIERLALQSLTVDGVRGAEKDVEKRWYFFKGLELDEINDLSEKFDAADCGVDLEIQTRCHGPESCNWLQDIQLPFHRGFYQPKKKPIPVSMSAPDSSETSSPG